MSTTQEPKLLPRPFLKWAGGKTQLLPLLKAAIPSSWDPKKDHYHEPFLGAGALYFSLLPANAHLADANSDLMNCWQEIRDHVDRVVQELVRWRDSYSKEPEPTYYAVRNQEPTRLDPPSRAARLIFLNKAGFNGLYRVNKGGGFNVPWGKNPKANVLDEVNLRNCARVLSQAEVELSCHDFGKVGTVKKKESAKAGSLVYFDPPYAPVSKTSFTSFTSTKFGMDEQKRLAATAIRLRDRGIHVIVSQSVNEEVVELYRKGGFTCRLIDSNHRINSKASGRGTVGEYIIHG